MCHVCYDWENIVCYLKHFTTGRCSRSSQDYTASCLTVMCYGSWALSRDDDDDVTHWVKKHPQSYLFITLQSVQLIDFQNSFTVGLANKPVVLVSQNTLFLFLHCLVNLKMSLLSFSIIGKVMNEWNHKWFTDSQCTRCDCHRHLLFCLVMFLFL